MKKGYKIVSRWMNTDKLTSVNAHLIGDMTVVYRENEWVTVTKQPNDLPANHQKYGLFFFETKEHAMEWARTEVIGNLFLLELWECEVKGVAKKLPERLLGYISSIIYIPDNRQEWPQGTRMAHSIRLTKFIRTVGFG